MEYLLPLIVFGTFFVFMAVGVIFSNRTIKGSCGGLGTAMGNENCSDCSCGRYPKEQS